ncbi:transmembrane protein 214 [Anopheles nili]|uniref:transmembrane protein 214 n=1 Tax=Anopheles nili TaxID=185578 RepID=UPI00237B3B6C|nr:transmembrane protein 214 [Anopheles nili]
MSYDWEVVGKQKKPRKQTGGDKNSQSQNGSENAPKIEDAVNMDEICSLYADVKDELLAKLYGFKDATEKIDPKKSVIGTGNRTATPVRNQQSNNNKNKLKESETTKQPARRKKFTSLDAAILAINEPDLATQLAIISINYEENHLMLLEAVAKLLTDQLSVFVPDPFFMHKPVGYPYKSLPGKVRAVIDKCISKTKEEIVKYFYDNALSDMANEMCKSKHNSGIGYSLLLQAIALHYPKACINNLARNAILLDRHHRYNPSVGASILWTLGQGGYKDLDVGLKVWQDIMIPMMEEGSYRTFFTKYVLEILKIHQSYRLVLGGSEFLTILSSLTTLPGSVLRKPCPELDEAAELLVQRYVFSSRKASATFAMLFKNISFITHPTIIYYGLALCLLEDPESCSMWLKLYRQNMDTSRAILNYLNFSTHEYCSKLLREVHFQKFLLEVDEINQELSRSEKITEGLVLTTDLLKELQGKGKKKQSSKANSKASSSVTSVLCSFLLATFLLFGLTGALVGYDTYRAGGKFEASFTGQTLKQAGLLPAVQDAWTCSMKYSARGYKWAEANVPVYYQAASKALGPYVEFSIDFSKVLWNGTKKGFANAKLLVEQKLPVVAEFVEQYAPGLPKKIGEASCSFCDTVCTFASNAYKHTYEFFKTQVFVGKLSMESLGKAFNSTQQVAAQYYSWFNDQVDFYAKLK